MKKIELVVMGASYFHTNLGTTGLGLSAASIGPSLKALGQIRPG